MDASTTLHRVRCVRGFLSAILIEDIAVADVAGTLSIRVFVMRYSASDNHVSLDGTTIRLADFRGKLVLLNFWATWCPPCREEMPSMQRLHQRFKDQGLVLLAINIEEDGAKTVPPFVAQHHYSFPVLLDTGAKAQNLYQVFRFPETYIVDRNGVVVDKIIGGRNWLSGPLIQRLNFLLNG